MRELLFFVASSFWAGAAHAATPGHGKTSAAAYIVGARGKPIDAVILGIFVTLSHTSGIVIVGTLASLGSAWFVPQRTEAYLALGARRPALGPEAVPAGVPPAIAATAFAVPEERRAHSHDWHDHSHVHDH